MNFHLRSREISRLPSSLSGMLCIYFTDMGGSTVTGYLKEWGKFRAVIRRSEGLRCTPGIGQEDIGEPELVRTEESIDKSEYF